MWSLQDSSYRESAQQWKNSGIIEGWYGDGNFARTPIMYCFWKTQGLTISPLRDDIIIGAVYKNNELFILIKSEGEWKGKILFDPKRYKNILKLPIDYPRINQFPQWYIIKPQIQYKVKNFTTNSTIRYEGSFLEKGIFIELNPNNTYRLKFKVI